MWSAKTYYGVMIWSVLFLMCYLSTAVVSSFDYDRSVLSDLTGQLANEAREFLASNQIGNPVKIIPDGYSKVIGFTHQEQ